MGRDQQTKQKVIEIRTQVGECPLLAQLTGPGLNLCRRRVIDGRPQGLFGAPPLNYVNCNMAGLTATIEGVTPVSVRLSPCVSWIVRPDEVLVAWDMTAARSSAWVMPAVR